MSRNDYYLLLVFIAGQTLTLKMRRILKLSLIVLGLFYLITCCCGGNKPGPGINNGKNSKSNDFSQMYPNQDKFLRNSRKLCSVDCTIGNENTFLYEHETKFSDPAGVLHCLVKCTDPNCWSCQITIDTLQLDRLAGDVTILNISSDFKEEDKEMLKVEFIEVEKTEITTPKHVDLLIFGNLACDWSCFETLLRYDEILGKRVLTYWEIWGIKGNS